MNLQQFKSDIELVLKLTTNDIKSEKKSQIVKQANGEFELSPLSIKLIRFGNIALYTILICSIIYLFI
jgi:hypothetical protein